MYKKHLKRFIDIACSFVAIIALFPIMLIIALLIWFKLGKPVLFKQDRVGLNNKLFTLYKFRTMTQDTDRQGNLLPDEERLHPFGKKIRSLSLDELPQLFNILLGDMSIIGPRPLLPIFLTRYTDEQKRRHEVKPGLSNIAEVTGRVNQSWEDKFIKDVWYVDNISFALDCKILLKTVVVVIKREGIVDTTGVRGRFVRSDSQDNNEKNKQRINF